MNSGRGTPAYFSAGIGGIPFRLFPLRAHARAPFSGDTVRHQVLAPRSTTAASSATSARASASSTKASAGSASSARAQDDQIVLTTYGRSSGFCVDPIEKKPLNHFLPGTPVLSFGTAGCNLACKFCQNWDISQVARDRHAGRPGDARARSPRGGRALGCRERRLHLQRPGDLPRVRDRRRRRLPRARASRPSRSPPATSAPSRAREFYRHMDAANVDLKALHRALLPQDLRRRTSQPVLDTLRLPQARDRRLVRDHDAADPRRERLRRGDRRDDALDRRAARPRRAAALHRLPPRLQDDRPAADAARDADARARSIALAQRPALRLHRQRPRPRRRQHLLPRLRRAR